MGTSPNCPDLFENVLVYEQRLPFQWEPFRPGDRTSALVDINDVNEQILQAMLCLDEHPRELDDASSEIMHEFQRMEAKMDLLLRWVGQTLSASQGMPEKRLVRLSENGLAVEIADQLTPGAEVLVRINLMMGFPEPLLLPGEVISAVRTPDGVLATIVFTGQSDEVCDLLEKFIFRKHRRMVALQKKLSS